MSNIIADYQTITAWNWRGSSFRQLLNYLCTKQGALICGKFILKSGHTLSFSRSNNASRSNVTFSRTWQTSREYFNRHFQTKISLTYLALCSHLLISQRNSERGDNWRLACAVGGLFSRGTKQQQKPVISLRSRSFRLHLLQLRRQGTMTFWQLCSKGFEWNTIDSISLKLQVPFYFSVSRSISLTFWLHARPFQRNF